MTKDWAVYAIHILESIDRIRRYYKDLKEGDVDAEMAYDAIVRNLETMSEAASDKLPDGIKAKYAEIDWEAIKSFRIRLAHIYLDIDHRVIDQTIENDLSDLYDAMLTEVPDWDDLKKKKGIC